MLCLYATWCSVWVYKEVVSDLTCLISLKWWWWRVGTGWDTRAYCSFSKFFWARVGREDVWFTFNVLFGEKSDYNVLYCCVEKVLCMHIFNKEFRVLRNKKEKVTHGSLVVRSHDLFTRLTSRKPNVNPDFVPVLPTWQSTSQGVLWKTLG